MEQPEIINCKLKPRSWRARLAGWVLRGNKTAIVFGDTIHLWNFNCLEFMRDKDLVCHELTHVLQYQRYGYWGFLRRYLWETIKHGYYNNPLEKEARGAEKNHELLNRAKITFLDR